MDRYKSTRVVAILGITANTLLLILKLTIGFFSNSQAMIADGFNSAGDVFASTMTYIGNKISGKPEDENHPYGHGKAEYIFSMIISFSLLLVGYKIFSSALNSILYKRQFTFSIWLVAVAITTIVLKSGLFLFTRKIGRQQENILVLANSEDHRNDVIVTSSALLGILLGKYNVYWFDGVAGIGIALWIVYTAIRIFINAYKVLMDTDINEDFKQEILHEIQSIKGVEHVDHIAAKPIGVHYILIVKVSVNGKMSVENGHIIAGKIREALRSCKNISDAIIHINPS